MQRVHEAFETEYEEFHSDNLALTTKIHAVSVL